jgi:hypothetical protein
MKKKILVLEFIIFIFVLCVMYTSIQAFASNQKDAGFLPDKIGDANASIMMDKYSQSEYYFDSKDEGIVHPVNSSISMMMNGASTALFRINVIVSYCVSYLIMSVYNLDIFKWVPDIVNDCVRSVKANTFDLFLPCVFVVIGCIGMWKSFKGSSSGGFRVVFPMLIVLFFATCFFRDPAALGTNFNNTSSVICNAILEGIGGKVLHKTPDQKVENAIADQYWTLTVMKPYELIEFGSIEAVQSDKKGRAEEYFLGKSKEERQANAAMFSDADKNDNFNYNGAGGRFGMAIFLVLFTLVMNASMLVILFTLITVQAAALFWIMFGAVFFLVGMFPGKGMRVVVGWFVETFGFVLKRVIITIALSVYFCLQSAIYNKTGDYGFLFVSIFSIVMIIAAIKNFNSVYENLLSLVNFYDNKWHYSKSSKTAILPASHVLNTFRRPLHAARHEYNDVKEDAIRKFYSREAKMSLHSKYETLKETDPTNSFVKNVNDRVARGMKPFSNEQIDRIVEDMYSRKKQGDKPRRLYKMDAKDRTVREMSKMAKSNKASLKQSMKSLNRDARKNNMKMKVHGAVGKFYF